MKLYLRTIMVCLAACSMAQAQTADSAVQAQSAQANDPANTGSVGSERARLGMQRIQTETEVRAREEQQRLEQAEMKARQEQWRLDQAERERAQAEAMRSQAASAAATESQAASAPSPKPQSATAVKSKDMSRTLEQLRTLGELKDDGYISGEEFQRIKQKILDNQL